MLLPYFAAAIIIVYSTMRTASSWQKGVFGQLLPYFEKTTSG